MKRILELLCVVMMLSLCLGADGCNDGTPTSASGLKKYTVSVPTDNEGRSIEQRLIGERLKRDNTPGAFKYVYVINTYTGTVMYQSTAVGKVVSSGKRLTPVSVSQNLTGSDTATQGMVIDIGSGKYTTTEVLQDDGTYGSSSPYLYWFDPQNAYHQVYADAIYVHVSSVPLIVRNATLTMEIDHTQLNKPTTVAPEMKEIMDDFKEKK